MGHLGYLFLSKFYLILQHCGYEFSKNCVITLRKKIMNAIIEMVVFPSILVPFTLAVNFYFHLFS